MINYLFIGVSAQQSCPVGHYCGRSELSSPEGLCSAGRYCISNSTTAVPDGSDATGNFCQPGYYCEKGTEAPQSCPNGTFSNSIGLEASENCSDCTAGHYCDQPAPTGVSGPCSAGYYCPGRDVKPDSEPCPKGHMCPVKSDQPIPCDSGYYQNEDVAADCKLCPAGCVCNSTFGPVIQGCAVVCPTGHYCLNGTTYAEQYPCPKG